MDTNVVTDTAFLRDLKILQAKKPGRWMDAGWMDG